jgi:cell cycle sensor histidine kinase DivJ
MHDGNNDILGWIVKRGGYIVNSIWIGTLVVAIPQIWNLLGGTPALNAIVLAAIAFPAIAGFVLMSRLDRPFERFTLALFWTAFAAIVTTLGGGVTGSGVLAFLLPPAVAAASGGREAITKAAALSGVAAIVVSGLQLTGFIRPAPEAMALHLPFILGTALIFAFGFGFAAIRAVRGADRARREARHSRIRGLAFDASPVALLACDPDGHILAASQGVRTLSPGLPRILSNLPIADIGFDSDDRAQLAGAGRRAAQGGLTDYLTIRGKTGRAQTVRLDAAPIYGGSVAAFTSDTSILAESTLREADEARLQAEEDTRAKSQYLASVSHELRTPLNAIIGFSDVMKARLFGPMPARYAEYADLIHESGQHLMDLIGDVLDMSKIEADHYELSVEEFKVGEVVSISTKLMRLQAEEAGLTLVVEEGEKDIIVEADRKALRQILLNLLSNAVKFTPKGGAIVVMTRISDDNLILAVGDSGVGIETDEISRLGQPYMQASSATETEKRGTGLGLSLVKALAELHDGTMNILSQKGEGTTISVILPILKETQGGVTEHPVLDVHRQIERAQSESRKRVPVVDAA